jgi:hypothetical protein
MLTLALAFPNRYSERSADSRNALRRLLLNPPIKGWIASGRARFAFPDVEDAANGAVGLLPPADRIRYERWLRCGGMATVQLAAPVLFGANGAAAVAGSGPCAAGLAKAIRTVGLDRWPRVVAAMAEQASAEAEVTLPPGNY